MQPANIPSLEWDNMIDVMIVGPRSVDFYDLCSLLGSQPLRSCFQYVCPTLCISRGDMRFIT